MLDLYIIYRNFENELGGKAIFLLLLTMLQISGVSFSSIQNVKLISKATDEETHHVYSFSLSKIGKTAASRAKRLFYEW